ncbi:alpha/beta fold hydrolase [Lichenicoccus sp.]|uniref:alpha/beta fold hydrolase n=1 Tax=Lichenicoccus sp. TaxID=2781899 RepID=UPI003D14F5ED
MADRLRWLETVTAGDSKIVTSIDGAGPTLVMLPSYGRDGFDDFDRVTDLMVAEGWRVLRPQPRGIAGSSGPMKGVNISDLVNDVAGVIRKLGDAPAVVLGHAFGNFVAHALTVDYPDLVRGVILAPAAPAAASTIAPEVAESPMIAGDPTRPEEERLAALHLAFFVPGHDPSPWLDGWYPETLAMQLGALKATKLDPFAFGGVAPILEIIGRFDPFKPQNLWSEMDEGLGDRATTVIIDDASHALFPEQPDLVAEAVLRWAARLQLDERAAAS